MRTFVVLSLLIPTLAWAQQPVVTNGTLETRAIAGPLDREMAAAISRAAGPSWIGYTVAVEGRRREIGCWSEEGRQSGRVGPLRLEGAETFFVLYRIESKMVDRIRIASSECELDAGGRSVIWLTGVRPDDSIAWLATFVTPDSSQRMASGALAAMAMHAGTAATDRLIDLARKSESSRVRGNALFWLAQRAGSKATETITGSVADDPDTEVKRKAVFALSQLPNDEAVPRLIDVARSHSNPAVRKQAMFWLGQSKDPRALRFFEEILR